jgi:transposase-like protein
LWLEVTAAGKAKKVGVPPKTVAKYYRIIRERIAAECEAGLDSIVYSDGWKAYSKLSLNGFLRRRINHDNHDKTLVDGK